MVQHLSSYLNFYFLQRTGIYKHFRILTSCQPNFLPVVCKNRKTSALARKLSKLGTCMTAHLVVTTRKHVSKLKRTILTLNTIKQKNSIDSMVTHNQLDQLNTFMLMICKFKNFKFFGKYGVLTLRDSWIFFSFIFKDPSRK